MAAAGGVWYGWGGGRGRSEHEPKCVQWETYSIKPVLKMVISESMFSLHWNLEVAMNRNLCLFLIMASAWQCCACVTFLSTCHVSPCHAVLLTSHMSLQCFFEIFPASSLFRIKRHKFSALKTYFNANTCSQCWQSNSPLSAQWSSLPLPTQWSSSTHPASIVGHRYF